MQDTAHGNASWRAGKDAGNFLPLLRKSTDRIRMMVNPTVHARTSCSQQPRRRTMTDQNRNQNQGGQNQGGGQKGGQEGGRGQGGSQSQGGQSGQSGQGRQGQG